jgi:hypothetical protein
LSNLWSSVANDYGPGAEILDGGWRFPRLNPPIEFLGSGTVVCTENKLLVRLFAGSKMKMLQSQ